MNVFIRCALAVLTAGALMGCAAQAPYHGAGTASRNWPLPILATLSNVQVTGDVNSAMPGIRPGATARLQSALAGRLQSTLGAGMVADTSEAATADLAEAVALVEMLAASRLASRPSTELVDQDAGVGSTLAQIETLRPARTLVVIAGGQHYADDDTPSVRLLCATIDVPTGRLIALSRFEDQVDLADSSTLNLVMRRLLLQ